MAGTAVPQGYRTVTPYVTVQDPEAMVRFVVDALGGAVVYRLARAAAPPATP